MRRGLAVITIAAVGLLPMPATAQTAPTCFGMEVTILGTEGPDGSLRGTEGPDVMHGLGGDDWMNGWLLRDWMCGGEGDDNMNGEQSHDFMDGGLNADQMRGGPGNDKLFGGPGPDGLIDWGWGADYMDGGPGNDGLANSSDEPDRPSSDTLLGGHGNDVVTMSPFGSVRRPFWGKDVIRGGTGDDELWSTSDYEQHQPEEPGQEDTVNGGDGTDTCYVDADDTVTGCEQVTVVG